MKMYTPQEIASLFQVPLEVIQSHIEEGRLKGINVGLDTEEWRFVDDDIANFITSVKDDQQINTSTSSKPAAQARTTLPAVLRINLKPAAEPNTDPRKLCIEKGVAGMGWSVNVDSNVPLEWDRYRQLAAKKFPDGTWMAVIKLYEIPINGVIWTRRGYGKKDTEFYAGLVIGPWEYRGDPESLAADVPNIRPVTWHLVGGYDDVPPAIAKAFTPTVISSIKKQEAIDFTEELASKLISQGIWVLR